MALRSPALLLASLLGACTAQQQPSAMPSAAEAGEALPPHWVGSFTLVETRGTPFPGQAQLALGRGGPDHFRATRGCYSREGRLRREGARWRVEYRGGVQIDQQCLAGPLAKGSAAGLFEHRTIAFSPPGERWIEENGARWIYIMNPPSPPSAPPAPPPPIPEPPANPAGVADHPDAAEALYRHQIGNNASGGQRNVAALCLAVGKPNGVVDPPASLLARFGGDNPPVKGVSGCRWDNVHWTDRATGGHAVVHYIAGLSCSSAVRCIASGGYLEGNLSASGNEYVLERRNGRWQVTSDRMNWIS